MRKLKQYLQGQADRAFALQQALTARQAIGPENGGQGEAEKAGFVLAALREAGVDQIEVFQAPDARVASGSRPNIVARVPGRVEKTLWLFGHMDVVPPGDLSLWRTDPWHVAREGDKIYGRGVEDNQQAMVSMLLLAEALQHHKITPELSLGLVFMADEECGSACGLDWLLSQKADFFGPDDFYIVPDGGSPESDLIEIAEKAQLWLKFSVNGKQCHASMPANGSNALVGASALIMLLQTLNATFEQQDAIFTPPNSTFVPTKHDQNVDAINILPGLDVFYLDCRLLPQVDPKDVLHTVGQMAKAASHRYGVQIQVDIVQEHPASRTAANAPVVLALQKAIAGVYNVQPRVCGIGGATVAAFLRARGLPAAVWSTILNTCHQPNECALLSAACNDAAVFAHILMDEAHAGQ